MIKFIKVFRDKNEICSDGLAKRYLPLETAKFSKARETEIVKLGFAVSVNESKPKENKSGEPKNIEKK